LAADAIAQRHRYGPLGRSLPHDVLVKLQNDLARRHVVERGRSSSPSTGGAPLPPGAMINSFSDLVGMSCSIPLLRKNSLLCFHV